MNTSQSFIFFMFLLLHNSKAQLRVGFYTQTCPKAESIVHDVVREATLENPRMPPMLLRLQFHDCFVEGCDGSILIDNGASGEKKASENQGLGGFEEVEKAKGLLEAECPGVVSCADILAMAARDAVVMAGGPFYDVETGRRDGRISSVSLANNMPDVNDSIETLKSKFRDKGLSEKELVLLSGAHTIGTTACFFMPTRLYNFSGRNDSDPDINPNFLTELKNACPNNGDVNLRIPLDVVTVDRFDDQILHNIKNGIAVIASDARLYDDVVTQQVVDSYVDGTKGVIFGQDFAVAMVKMGRIGAKIGGDGEIRRVCNTIN